MRVRHLQTYLGDAGQVKTGQLHNLNTMRIGVDAVYWVRTLIAIKDPLADAIGGLPPNVFSVLDRQLELFRNAGIHAVFVFQGMQPRSHQLFQSQLHQQMDEAWRLLAKGDRPSALHKFSQATSRINSDFVQFVLHYLKSKGCDCIQAPYFATAQLAYLVEEGFFDAVFGPPALLLFGVPRVIIAVDFKNGRFDWVELRSILVTWGLNMAQFVDCCLLAGTEYCLTFPYLNLTAFHGGGANFTFGTAVEFIRQAPLICYMQHFPNEDMRNDHVDGYCVCKALIHYPLALHLDGNVGAPTSKQALTSEGSQASGETPILQPATPPLAAMPRDYYKIVGARLPNSVYFLMGEGVLSRKLPSVLALGEWLDYSHPTVDSVEYREILNEIQSYRCRALGLVAMRLHSSIRNREIKFSRYSCTYTHGNEQAISCSRKPDTKPGIAWNFTGDDVRREMQRQNTNDISLTFCLRWHAHATNIGKSFVSSDPRATGPQVSLEDPIVCLAIVHFMLLENLEYFVEDGGTVFGSVLCDAPAEFQEDVLFSLELMRLGVLFGDQLEAPPDRAFPEDIRLLRNPANAPIEKSILLLSRVFSLIPVQLKPNDNWNAEVDFDLAAFHSIVKIIKRTLRQLVEACLASLLLRPGNAGHVRHLPANYFNPLDPKMPCFLLPRNCLGILLKHVLEVDIPIDPSRLDFEKDGRTPEQIAASLGQTSGPLPSAVIALDMELRRCYPACIQPLRDIITGLKFWNEMQRVVEGLLQHTDQVSQEDFNCAHNVLMDRLGHYRVLDLDLYKETFKGCPRMLGTTM